MSIERAKEYLKEYGLDEAVQEFEVSSATVELAAKAVGTEPGRIAKTLAFMGEDGPVLILAAGDVKISNPKYKGTFHLKAKMIPPDKLVELVGHEMGGVCPFGVKDGVKVYLDESLKKYDYVFPAAGSGNSCIKMDLDELEKVSQSLGWIDVCKEA